MTLEVDELALPPEPLELAFALLDPDPDERNSVPQAHAKSEAKKRTRRIKGSW